MKHVKKFEHFTGFDLGQFTEEEGTGPEFTEIENVEDKEDCVPCGTEESDEDEDDFTQTTTDEDESEDENDMRRKVWGDEITVERISSFVDFLSEAKKSKGLSYKKSGLKHPEKADLDKDKKISSYEKKRGKAVQDSVQDEKEEGKNNKKDNKKEDDKKPKFGSKEWREKYTKKK